MLRKWDRALFDLWEEGKVDEFEAVVREGVDWTGEDEGYTAAMLAAGAGRADVLEEVLKQGVDPNSKGGRGRTAMFEAVAGGRADLVRLLIAYGATADADIDEEDEDSALHEASEYGNLEIVELLLGTEHGNSLEFFDYIARTPLACASHYRHPEVVDCLIRAGANVNAFDDTRIGETALGRLLFGRCDDDDAIDEVDLAIVKMLLDAGANPLVRGCMWNTAYSRAQAYSGEIAGRIVALMDAAIARIYPEGPPEEMT